MFDVQRDVEHYITSGAYDRDFARVVADARAYLERRVKGVEVALEGTYLIQLTPWLAMQPDVQYVLHPNTDPAISNALVAVLRFELSF